MNPRERRRHRLRKRLLAWRERLARAEVVARSRKVAARVEAWMDGSGVRCLCSYAAFRGEVETLPIVEAALARGIRVAMPRVMPDRRLVLSEIRSPERDLEPGRWGVLEPLEGLPAVDPGELDAVLVPGLAFDLRGHRLGYGKGYYDRLLRRLPGRVRTAGLCFWEQVFSRLPEQPWDVPVDLLFSDAATVPARLGGDRRASPR